MKGKTDAARGVLWLAMAVLLVLVWLGPASWLRVDPLDAEAAEREADDAETAARVLPELSFVEARERLDRFEAIRLVTWDEQAVFWDELFPEPPEGVRLAGLGTLAPESSGVEGVHLRSVSLELEVVRGPEDDPDSGVQPVAPGGLNATWEWIASLNSRPDMQLLSVELSTTGAARMSFEVWLRDAPETAETSPETAGE